MFGMIDYRAHKLYVLLFFPLFFLLRLLSLFAVPFSEYAIGVEFASERIWQIALTIAVIIPVEIVWFFFVKGISAAVNGLFNFIIDVIPVDGRSKEEAQQVVWGGDEAVAVWHLDNTAPNKWSDEIIRAGTKGDIFGRYFAQRRRERINALKEHYVSNPDIEPNEYNAEQFLRDNEMWPPLEEKIISNKYYRGMVIAYPFLLYLLIAHPLAN